MAQLGRQGTKFFILGTKRTDPLPTKLRSILSLRRRKELLYRIVRDAGIPMRDMMRAGSPVRTGVLKQSFHVRKAKKQRFTEVAVFVGGIKGTFMGMDGPKKYAGWRAHWAELGTVNHPGRYFLQPAIRLGIFRAKALIRARISKLVRNLGKLK